MITTIKIGEKVFNREEYPGDFDKLILNNLQESKVENYAKVNLDMVKQGRCGCEPEDFDFDDLIYTLEDYGFKVVKCETLADSMKLEKLKELMSA